MKLNSVVNAIDRVLPWQYKGLSNESIKPFRTSDISLKPSLSYYSESRIRVKFARNCLIQDKITFIHEKIVNIYIVYELGASTSHSSDLTLKRCLLGAFTLTKNADIEKYRWIRSKCIDFWSRYAFFYTY